jgi:hypothetical protein
LYGNRLQELKDLGVFKADVNKSIGDLSTRMERGFRDVNKELGCINKEMGDIKASLGILKWQFGAMLAVTVASNEVRTSPVTSGLQFVIFRCHQGPGSNAQNCQQV